MAIKQTVTGWLNKLSNKETKQTRKGLASNEDLPFEPSTWKVEVSAEGVFLQRMHGGRWVESYALVSHAKGRFI